MSFKFGVIGAGGIAYRRLIPEVMKELQDVEIAAVMDIRPETAEKVGREFGVKWYENENDLLALDYIDAVYIATPQSLHVNSVLNSAAHKKHILVEKPMGTSIEDDVKMILACETNRVQLGVAYMMRYNAYNKKILEIIKSGKIGKPVMGRAQLTCWFPRMEGNWRQNYDISRGGALMDMGGHCIDLLTMFFGDVAEVAGFQDNLVHDYFPVEDTSTALLRFKNGAHGIIDNYFNIPDNAARNRIEVYGSKGSIIGEGTIGQDAGGGKIEVFIQEENSGYIAGQIRNNKTKSVLYDNLSQRGLYAQEAEDFARAVRSGKNPTMDGYQAMKNDKVTLAIYEAARTRRVVKI